MVPPMDKQHSMAALHTDANASAKGRRPITAKLIRESATVIPKIEYLSNKTIRFMSQNGTRIPNEYYD